MNHPTNVEICQWHCRRCGAVLATQLASDPDYGKKPPAKCSCSTIPDDRLPPFPVHFFDDANPPLKKPSEADDELLKRVWGRGIKKTSLIWSKKSSLRKKRDPRVRRLGQPPLGGSGPLCFASMRARAHRAQQGAQGPSGGLSQCQGGMRLSP